MLYFITFLVIANGIANAQDCSKPPEEKCAHLFPAFPETAEELKEACKQVKPAFECVAGHAVECSVEGVTPSVVEDMREFLYEACNESSLLNAALVDNFDCMNRELFQNELSCVYPANEEMQRLADILSHEVSEDAEDPYECLRWVKVDVCIALKLENKCGPVAMQVFLEYITRTAAPSCRDEKADLVPAMLRVLKLSQETGEFRLDRKK